MVGVRDVCDRFLIPEKLYGREAEVQALLDAFERIANPPESGHRRTEMSTKKSMNLHNHHSGLRPTMYHNPTA